MTFIAATAYNPYAAYTPALNYGAAPAMVASTPPADGGDTYLPDPKFPEDPNAPPLDPPYKENFFHRADVRLAGMALASGTVMGGIGYAIGARTGSAVAGAAIGATIGVLAPVALIAYGLYRWGKGN